MDIGSKVGFRLSINKWVIALALAFVLSQFIPILAVLGFLGYAMYLIQHG